MKVLVEGNNNLIVAMFTNWGWEVVKDMGILRDLSGVDLVCFEGGADVSPYLYGAKNTDSHCSDARDFHSIVLYQQARRLDIPMVGICRGGQFLNVMAGGEMIQDYPGHAIRGTHTIHYFDELDEKRTCEVTSTHHQVMKPNQRKQNIIGWAGDDWQGAEAPVEVEIVWNFDDFTLSFQPHPEYVDRKHECQKLFFLLLDRIFGLKV